jgi:hypothetical protein
LKQKQANVSEALSARRQAENTSRQAEIAAQHAEQGARQAELATLQATETARQGKTVLLFTVVTIIFVSLQPVLWNQHLIRIAAAIVHVCILCHRH